MPDGGSRRHWPNAGSSRYWHRPRSRRSPGCTSSSSWPRACRGGCAASAGSLETAVRAIAVARLNNPQRSPCRASIRIRNILLPRPVLRVTPPAWRLEPLLVLCAVAEPRERAKSGRFQEVLSPNLGTPGRPASSVGPYGATVTATAQSITLGQGDCQSVKRPVAVAGCCDATWGLDIFVQCNILGSHRRLSVSRRQEP